MKKLYLLLIAIIGMGLTTSVYAQEQSNVGTFTLVPPIGGTTDAITQDDDTAKVKYYYKVVQIDSAKFNEYTAAKYGIDNLDSASSEYTEASTKAVNLETEFGALIPAVNAPSDITAEGSGWTAANGKVISLSNLVYNQGQHSGYLLAVAGIKDGDTANVYMIRMPLEATSATTLGVISYLESDRNAYQTDTNTDSGTDQNPNTGLEDCLYYVVPVSIVLGSILILKRSYA